MNNDALLFFEKMTFGKNKQNSVKLANNTDYTDVDADFIMNYADVSSDILDLGTGTGLIVNKIFDKVHHIDVVEPYSEFTKYIIKSEKITIHNVNAYNFNIDKKYNLITAFGFMHYFNESEAIEVYQKYKPYLMVGGKIIIKNQFGISEDITISGYSKEQKTDYFAQYRYIKKEVQILENLGYKNPEVFDIYPPKCNRWNNTHFYAIVAKN